MSREQMPRRGIVLLIVLSLLILFLLIGVTYVLSGSQFKRNASVAARYDQFTDPPQVLVQSVMMELIRGSNNARSGIQSQNLLEDMYGSNWYAGTIAGITSAAGTDANGKPFDTKGQFLEILGAPTGLGDGFFNGCVLTITDGPAQGISTRIVGYQSARGAVWVMPLVGYYPGVMPIPTKDHYLINGRQFSGTGAGYNPTTGMCDAMSGGYPIALTPNPAGTSGYNGLAGTGGQNEEYDVADYQNPFLAFHPPGATKYSDIIPSFHRPALIAYWTKQQGKTSWDQLDPKLLAKIMWRPNKLVHPIFASTVNPMFDPINGPWDVDTDGDGYNDAVWIDVGMPPGMDKDGRKYKMLVAYQVLDLDGRINTNVHGKVPASGSAPNNSGFGITPYEVAQSFRTAGQFSAGNFTPAELETVARQNDMDRNLLPGRLVSAGASGPMAAMLTTEGYGVPGTSGVSVPVGASSGYKSIVDLVRAKLTANGITGVAADKEIAKLVAPEMLAGLPLNLNRTLADGSTNDDPVISPTQPYGPRQILARHLYVLLWLLTDDSYVAARYPDDLNWNTIPPTPISDLQVKAKRFAQWAVNVVDFRDPDSAMTPFEYQLNPFNGWKVDGNPATDEGANRGVAWGCEHPDLLLMESFACHNRNALDSAQDDSGAPSRAGGKLSKGSRSDLDQVRLPEGSLFVKVFCPPAENTSSLAGDVYANGVLDLEKLAPADPNFPATRFPVWRMITSLLSGPLADPHYDDEAKDQNGHIVARRYRIVWFTNNPPSATGNDVRIFYSRSPTGTGRVSPGGYLTIAPRRTTYFGSQYDATDTSRLNPKPADNPLDLPGALIVGADRPEKVAPYWPPYGLERNGPPFIGMNITEPMPLEGLYYGSGEGEDDRNKSSVTHYSWSSAWLAKLGYNDAYGVNAATATAANSTFPYRVVDDPDRAFTYAIYGRPIAELGASTSNNEWPNYRDTGTYLNWRYLHLQRLADPLKPHNESTNPYIAVDWMPIDMTLFTGENPNFKVSGTNSEDPTDPLPGRNKRVLGGVERELLLRWASRQRAPASSVDLNVPWRGVFPNPPETPAVNVSTNLNNFPAPLLKHNFASANATYPNPAAFPPVTWNNRDYYSGHELLMVPAVAPQHLTTVFSLPSMTANGIAGIDPFNPASTVAAPYFGHLQNFFQYSMTATPKVANFYRILDYVTASVPLSPTLTKQTLTPIFSGPAGGSAPTFRPPANAVSTYRTPGLVNVNSISSPLVWQLLMNGYPNPNWDQFVKSRRGYGTSSNMTEIDANYPSNFMGVFRAPQGGNLVPVASMRRPGIYTGLMRPDPTIPTKPMFLDTTNTSFDTTRNPRWTFHGIERMSNLTTTRSSVFAVWITVGFFEAIPHTGAADATLWPDGYELGSELNADTGDVKRYRAFYIFDRSIPVGYERGQDHNVHKAILLSKFIE